MSYDIRFESAKDRFPKYFKISQDLIDLIEEMTNADGVRDPESASDHVMLGSFNCAFNLYTSINLLLQNGFWENASILMRSLYELVLNLTEIVKDPASEESKATAYLKFCELQKYLVARERNLYALKTGRAKPDMEEIISKLDEHAQRVFAEFRQKKHKADFSTYWSGKSVRQLAKDSPNHMHLHHYDLTYAYCSAFSHSTPFAITADLNKSPDAMTLESFIRSYEDTEEDNLQFVMLLSSSWMIEVLHAVSPILRRYDGVRLTRLKGEWLTILGISLP